MTGIEKYNAIPARVVIFLVPCQEHVCPQVGEHLAYAVNEYVWLVVTVVGGKMLFNLVAYEMNEIVRIGFASEFLCHHVGIGLVALEGVFQQRGVAKLLVTQIVAKHLEKVNLQCVYKISGSFQFLLELLYLPPHFIFLAGLILIYVVVVEYITAFFIQKLWRAELIVQLINSHSSHCSLDFMSLISYG